MRRGSRRAAEAVARTPAPIHPRRAAGRAPRPVTAPSAHRPLRLDDLGRPAVPGCRARGNRLPLVHARDFTRLTGASFGARSPRQPPRPRTAPRTPGHLFLLPQRRLRRRHPVLGTAVLRPGGDAAGGGGAVSRPRPPTPT